MTSRPSLGSAHGSSSPLLSIRRPRHQYSHFLLCMLTQNTPKKQQPHHQRNRRQTKRRLLPLQHLHRQNTHT